MGEATTDPGLAQQSNEHRPERRVLLAVDQQLREGSALRVGPELSDPLGPVKVGQHQDLEELGTSSRARAWQGPYTSSNTERLLAWSGLSSLSSC